MMERARMLVAASVVMAGCGGAGDDRSGALTGSGSISDGAAEPRTVEVSMVDNAFVPSVVDVEVGETIRFVFRNDGMVRHEAVVGTLTEQEAHRADMAEMADMAGMGDDHSDPDSMGHGGMDMGEYHSVVVEPGAVQELLHTFPMEGPVLIGCHQPSHWEAGMRITIDV